jgi:hypothetical protein
MRRKKTTNPNRSQSLIKHNLKSLILIISILFLACQEQKAKTGEKANVEYTGVGCGTINSEYGDIRLLSEIDSSTYLLVVLKNRLTLVESGDITLTSTDTINRVFILDFNTDKKVYETIAVGIDLKGYIFPCSDIVVPSHVPDTLTLSEGQLHMTIQALQANNNRDYLVHVENVKFSSGNKVKYMKSHRGKIKFAQGDPG